MTTYISYPSHDISTFLHVSFTFSRDNRDLSCLCVVQVTFTRLRNIDSSRSRLYYYAVSTAELSKHPNPRRQTVRVHRKTRARDSSRFDSRSGRPVFSNVFSTKTVASKIPECRKSGTPRPITAYANWSSAIRTRVILLQRCTTDATPSRRPGSTSHYSYAITAKLPAVTVRKLFGDFRANPDFPAVPDKLLL